MKLNTIAGLVLVTVSMCPVFRVSANTGTPTVQALLGAVRYDGLEVDLSPGTDTVTVDVSTMPQFGGAWATAPRGERLQFGLECSFLMAFNFESDTFAPSANTRVSVDYDIWNFDLAGGLYANLSLGRQDQLRIYAASGPLIATTLFYSDSYVDNTIGDDEYRRHNESAFGYGLYARTGFEFRVHEAGTLGLGVRGTWVDTDLGTISDMTGIAAFVTYTTAL